MNRAQRRVHLVVWLALGPLLLAALGLALASRAPVPISEPVQIGVESTP